MRLRLRHLHLPSIHPHYIPYSLASRVQEHLRRQHLDFKDAQSHTSTSSSTGLLLPSSQPPPPTLISFTPSPIYTLGRRQTSPLTPSETARLTAPLQLPAPTPPPPPPSSSSSQGSSQGSSSSSEPASLLPVRLTHSPRGGLTTYHGPGQVVLWPVLDLKSRQHRQLTVRCWARALEDTTISTLGRVFRLAGFTTEDPGVWVSPSSSSSSSSPPTTTTRGRVGDDVGGGGGGDGGGGDVAKIAALGVHLRRHVTALGTAINVVMPGSGRGEGEGTTDERGNPWARIVACGLEGRGVTSVAGQLGGGVAEVDALLQRAGLEAGERGGRERGVAAAWAEELARRVEIAGGVEVVSAEETLALMEGLAARESDSAACEDWDERAGEEETAYLARIKELIGGR
ncbi:uncharacterized protein B0T15DRAFT_499033 [Chaetomium strumarium]|uniref:BPL/LPL catalytic domain-containing protein n=1 Tax=Chaetomium strumarium TaxID=1170767 RepID=A0AAJ0H367_9PEZI|nr:hypothetical protein B0T15DRAFT_499033 [Chaetomium strumarium]